MIGVAVEELDIYLHVETNAKVTVADWLSLRTYGYIAGQLQQTVCLSFRTGMMQVAKGYRHALMNNNGHKRLPAFVSRVQRVKLTN